MLRFTARPTIGIVKLSSERRLATAPNVSAHQGKASDQTYLYAGAGVAVLGAAYFLMGSRAAKQEMKKAADKVTAKDKLAGA